MTVMLTWLLFSFFNFKFFAKFCLVSPISIKKILISFQIIKVMQYLIVIFFAYQFSLVLN